MELVDSRYSCKWKLGKTKKTMAKPFWVKRFLLSGILLLPIVVRAQPSPHMLREATSTKQPNAYPILDREGSCLAWRTRTEVLGGNASGLGGTAYARNHLQVRVSGNGAVFAILEKMEEKQQPGLRLRWFDRQGRPRGAHVLPWHTDHPLPQFCFNAAASRLLIADAASARIVLLSAEGQVLAEAGLFGEPRYSNERPLFLAASNEEFFLLTQAWPSTSSQPEKPVLICFSAEGQERWRQELAQATAGGLAVSVEGHWILAGAYELASNQAQVHSSMQFFDRYGKLQVTREGLFRHAIFAQDGSRVLVMDRRQVRLLGLPGGELLWQSALSSRSEMFAASAGDASLESIFALIATSSFKGGRFVFEKARLVKFDASGRQQLAATLDSELIEPALAVSREGKQLALAAEGILRYYALLTAPNAAIE
jgi:hypothetical protein